MEVGCGSMFVVRFPANSRRRGGARDSLIGSTLACSIGGAGTVGAVSATR